MPGIFVLSINQTHTIMTAYEVRKAAESIVEEMGGNAEEICSGSCPDFAKALVDKCGGQIVSNLSEDMESELDGYETIAPDEDTYIPAPSRRNMWATSHCWVKINGRFYDAFNPEGVDCETELQFIQDNA